MEAVTIISETFDNIAFGICIWYLLRDYLELYNEIALHRQFDYLQQLEYPNQSCQISHLPYIEDPYRRNLQPPRILAKNSSILKRKVDPWIQLRAVLKKSENKGASYWLLGAALPGSRPFHIALHNESNIIAVLLQGGPKVVIVTQMFGLVAQRFVAH